MVQNTPSIVLDTSVVSILFRNAPDSPYYARRIQGYGWIISFQTLEELWFGAYNNGWGNRRRDELQSHLRAYAVVWPDTDMVDISARLRSDSRRKGRPLSHPDAWIAATALSLDCPLAAHDRDFSAVDGLALIQAPAA